LKHELYESLRHRKWAIWRINGFALGLNLEFHLDRPTWIHLGYWVITNYRDFSLFDHCYHKDAMDTHEITSDYERPLGHNIYLHTEPMCNKGFFNIGITIKPEYKTIFFWRLIWRVSGNG